MNLNNYNYSDGYHRYVLVVWAAQKTNGIRFVFDWRNVIFVETRFLQDDTDIVEKWSF